MVKVIHCANHAAKREKNVFQIYMDTVYVYMHLYFYVLIMELCTASVHAYIYRGGALSWTLYIYLLITLYTKTGYASYCMHPQ